MTMLRFAQCAIVIVLGAANISVPLSSDLESKTANLAQMRLENVRIRAQSMESLFSSLSFSYDIPIGVESAGNESERALYRIDFKKGSLSDLLSQFVSEYNQYAWKIEDGVVSVYPKENYRDPLVQELLATEISSFSVKENQADFSHPASGLMFESTGSPAGSAP